MAYFDENLCQIVLEDEDEEVKDLVKQPIENEVMKNLI